MLNNFRTSTLRPTAATAERRTLSSRRIDCDLSQREYHRRSEEGHERELRGALEQGKFLIESESRGKLAK